MMERLREGVNSIWVKVILGLIIFSFVFAGVGSYLAGGSQPAAAKINGTEISQNEFEQAYQNERNRMQSQLGDYFSTLLGDPEYVKQFRQSVLDRMINDVLIEQRATELGLRISDEHIRKTITSMPEFQRDGKFDNDSYTMLLRRSGFTPDQFAEYMRTDMLRTQFLTAIQGSDFALDSELTALRKLEAQQRVVRSLTLDLADFTKNATVTDEEAKVFYEQNPQMFTRPEQVKVAYIELSGEGLKDTLDVSDEDVKAYYEEHKDKYSSIEQRQVSHILVQGDNADAKAKAEALKAELDAGADFSELALSSSDDTYSAKDGGKLDWFERGVMDPAFEDAAFGLANSGDVSGVVKSSFGYHIIKLDAVKASQVKPFADVSAEIIVELREQQAAEHFYDMQTKLAETAFEMPDSLDDAAAAVNATVHTTDFISQTDAQGVLATPAVMQALFSAEVREDGLNSDVIEIAPEHVVVVRVDDSRDEMVLAFDEVSAKVKAQLASQKGEQNAQIKADDLIAALRAGSADVLEAEGLSFGEEQTISRSGPDRMVSQVAFSLTKPVDDKSVYGMTRDATGNVQIIALDKVIDVDVAKEAISGDFAKQVEQMNAQQDVAATLQALRDTAEVSYP
ncbi:peptidylprolyl isomerase [Photobacterium profundum]|uniref:Periplasmic chaperone PpiD n=1 Tax=Photobacterium profundum 3TCK TaxID=314280 RepID=Q1Z7Z8_9GAMM|nr:peptidylprolyl isomerase [Photobacterium profundum]EAS44715.1 putative peptidyl-prolyl cis-trans isomerase D [Photobacterium profundum 3TCK]PSV60701.1 peptidylprolyl isomerase [Photobacterium profundum]